MMKHKTQPVTQLDKHITEALIDGHLEMVGSDSFKLTEQGQQHVEDLFLVSADALETYMQLTLAHLNIRETDKQAVRTCFDRALAQSRFKDGVIKQLLDERNQK